MQNYAKRSWAMIVSAAMVLTVGVVGGTAMAEEGGLFDIMPAAVTDAKNKVEGLTPDGINIDLFDYWLTEQEAPDREWSSTGSATIKGNNQGINADHTLKFNPGTDSTSGRWNTWTSSTTPRTGIVQNELGDDGYPVLSGSRESLAYLFNENDSTTSTRVNGKAAYLNAGGLLQLDDNGNYTYDSTKNFASYNKDTNSFDLYNKWGVSAAGRSDKGQFFPFNSAEDVFTETRDGIIQKSGVTSNSYNDPSINHLFGMHMSATFVQPEDGYASSGTPMKFDFSGDDDVWVYIDGKLVGDLGGIHDMSTLSINFATGEVLVNGGPSDCSTESVNGRDQTICGSKSTLREALGLDDDTFADGTYHTIDLFYLERGNSDSNLRLTTNLVSVPESDIQKVDQNGDPVADASFNLYKAGDDYGYNAEQDLIASGSTDKDGMLTLVDTQTGAPINFSELFTNGIERYVLEETNVPNGYRKSKNAHLRYKSRFGSVTGTLVCDNMWETGVNVGAKAVVSAPSTLTDYNTQDKYDVDTNGGRIFAVIMARVSGVGEHAPAEGDEWKAVTGNAVDGWVLSDSPVTTINDISTLDDANKHTFAKGTDGKYSVSLDELPGDISLYTTQAGDNPDCQYSVGYYYEDARGQVHRLVTDDFERNFSTRLYVTDMENRLVVQKDDGNGNYLNGATFALYRADDTEMANGVRVPKAGATAVMEHETRTLTKKADGLDLEGGALFPSAGDDALSEGTYYLIETEAPAGYKKNNTAVVVIVDGNGVHADAGTADDGISTTVGVGRIAKSMAEYASVDDINKTLTDITATKRTGTLQSDGTLTWTEQSGSTVNLTYGAAGAVLEYGPTSDVTNPLGFSSDEGWTWFGVTQQAYDDTDADANLKENLDNRDITALFSGSVFVNVTDERVPSLEVTKTVTAAEGLNPNEDTSFAFRFTLPDSAATDKKYDAAVFNAKGIMQKVFRIGGNDGNDNVQSIKAGETIRIYGLADGASYTVTELTTGDDARDGYTLTSRKVGGQDYEKDTPGADISGTVSLTDTGAISPNNQLEFVNTYTVGEVTLKDGEFRAQKVLSGRDWDTDDSFLFSLTGQKGAPMPEGAQGDTLYKVVKRDSVATATYDDSTGTTTVTGQAQKPTYAQGDTAKNPIFSFGDITYTAPGTYTYTISEHTATERENSWLPGFGYSGALYTVTVTVTDNGAGALEISNVSMVRNSTDGGTTLTPATPVTDKIATITNNFSNDTKTIQYNIDKTYTDESGANSMQAGKFSFRVEGMGGLDNDDLDTIAQSIAQGTVNYTVQADAIPMPKDENGDVVTEVVNDVDGVAVVPNTTFTLDDDYGKTYVYRITENADADTTTSAGMSYDGTVYYVIVQNTHEDGDTNALKSTATYWRVENDGGTATLKRLDSARLSFENTYNVTSAQAPINGQKTLDGFALTTNDTPFEFTLSGANDATRTAMTDGTITRDENGSKVNVGESLTAKVEEGDRNATVSFSFGQLTFTKAGTYMFNVTENAPKADGNGMTYDRHTSTVTVTVTDTDANGNHTGKLNASVVYDNLSATVNAADRNVKNAAAFTNQYRASGTYAGIDVTKVLNGRNMTVGQFGFSIEADQQNPTGAAALDVPTGDRAFRNTAAAGSGETVTMANKLRFNLNQNHVGNTYKFTVKETGTAPDGYQYDAETATVSIEVKARDNDKSQLYTVTTVTKGNDTQTVDSRNGNDKPTVSFVNAYSASLDYDANAGFQIEKTFTAATGSSSGSFDFTVTPKATTSTDQSGHMVTLVSADDAGKKLGFSDEQIANGKSVSTGTLNTSITGTINATAIMGDNVSFTQADAGKTYTYTVKEIKPADAKNTVTYDDTEYTVTIAVADNGNGTLTVTTTVTKPGDDGATTTVGQKSVTTGATGGDAGAVTIPFVNTYTPRTATHTPKVTKKLAGNRQDALKDGEFTFQMTVDPQGSSPTDGFAYSKTADGADMTTATNKADSTVSFQPITFTKVGTYTVTIKEQVPADADKQSFMTYDTHEYRYTVNVTDNDGQLVATADTQNATGDSTFTNTYLELNYGEAGGLSITKTLTGRDMTAGQFEFTVTAKDGTGITAAEAAAKLGIDANGSTYASPAAGNGVEALVRKLGDSTTFSKADVGKTYVYSVEETKVGGEGYTNDTAVRTVSIAVSADAANATLTATTTVSKAGEEDQVFTYTTGGTQQAAATVNFANSYAADPATLGGDGEAKINASKSLTNRPMTDGEFKFTVVNTKDAAGKVVSNGANDASGNVSFTGIEYTTGQLESDTNSGLAVRTKADDGSYVYEYQYLVSEDTANLPSGVNGVDTSFTITVKVTDNGRGELAIEVGYPDGSDGTLAFANTYGTDASADLAVTGTKVLELDDPSLALTLGDISGKYDFELSGSEGAPLPEKTKATNDASGNVDFGTITYTMENVFGDTGSSKGDSDGEADAASADRTKTFTYTVSESGKVDGVTNDAKSSKTFTVTVTDNGDGTISVASDPAQGAKFTFTNTYGVDDQPSAVTDQIKVNKTLDGRAMAEGEFDFELVEGVGDDAKVVSTGTNAADGTVTFDAITYTTVGEHDYIIREVRGDAGGVTYDTATYQVHTSVTDAKNGSLTVTHALVDAKQATFANTYAADPTSASLGAVKTLEGRDLKSGEFTFELKDANGDVVGTAKNDADGRIAFDPIAYTKAGEYRYSIREVKGDAEGVTYDETEHTATVTVVDDLKGHLVATVAYENGSEPTFANTYTKPDEPGDEPGGEPGKTEGPLSDTGASVAVIGLVSLLLLAASGVALSLRRRHLK